MKGTNFSQIFEIPFTPPKIVSAVTAQITIAKIHCGTTGKKNETDSEIAEAWIAEPVPSVAIAVNKAKQIAPKRAHCGVVLTFAPFFLRWNAYSHTYIAPPHMVPFLSFTRYLTAI